MSDFYRITRNPETNKWEIAEWLDNYFGHRSYGVRFPDGNVYNPNKTDLETKDDQLQKAKDTIESFGPTVEELLHQIMFKVTSDTKHSVDLTFAEALAALNKVYGQQFLELAERLIHPDNGGYSSPEDYIIADELRQAIRERWLGGK